MHLQSCLSGFQDIPFTCVMHPVKVAKCSETSFDQVKARNVFSLQLITLLLNRFSYLILFFLRRCSRCHCKKSLRNGSLFAEFPRLPLGKLLLLLFLWSVRELRKTAAEMLGLTNNTVGNVYGVFRHYCRRDLQDRPIIPFGGNVYIVKCDESQFKHQSKVSTKALTILSNCMLR